MKYVHHDTEQCPPHFFCHYFLIEINQIKGNDFYIVNFYIQRDGLCL